MCWKQVSGYVCHVQLSVVVRWCVARVALDFYPYCPLFLGQSAAAGRQTNAFGWCGL